MANFQFYEDSGKFYPRVTSVIGQLDKSMFLIPWAVKSALDVVMNIPKEQMPAMDAFLINTQDFMDGIATANVASKKISEAAMEVGSMVHARAADIFNNVVREPTPISGEVHTAMLAFDAWKEHYHPEPLYVEKRMVGGSKTCPYGGTVDFIGKVNVPETALTKTVIIDFKTDKQIYPTTVIQMAAYWDLFDRDETIEAAVCVRLDKESGEYQHREYDLDELKVASAKFKALLKYWYLANGHKLKKAGAKKAK